MVPIEVFSHSGGRYYLEQGSNDSTLLFSVNSEKPLLEFKDTGEVMAGGEVIEGGILIGKFSVWDAAAFEKEGKSIEWEDEDNPFDDSEDLMAFEFVSSDTNEQVIHLIRLQDIPMYRKGIAVQYIDSMNAP